MAGYHYYPENRPHHFAWTRQIIIHTLLGENQEMALIKKEKMSLVQRSIAGALAKLTEKESFIVTHRLMTDDPVTIQEIGDRYNFTRERARQIETQAIKKLRLAIPYEVGCKNLPATLFNESGSCKTIDFLQFF